MSRRPEVMREEFVVYAKGCSDALDFFASEEAALAFASDLTEPAYVVCVTEYHADEEIIWASDRSMLDEVEF